MTISIFRQTSPLREGRPAASSLKQLQEVANKQAGDLQVVKEILQRMEA